MFDAFHDTLADADNGIFKSYAEFSAEPSARPETESTVQKTTADSETYAVSHLNLVYNLQDDLIGFIVGNPVQKVAEDEIFIWGARTDLRVLNS